jgi:plastocyanin
VFDNKDATTAHNVVVMNPDGSQVQMGGDTTPFMGPATRRYTMPALAAGSYPFHCQVHPIAMTGTLTVK